MDCCYAKQIHSRHDHVIDDRMPGLHPVSEIAYGILVGGARHKASVGVIVHQHDAARTGRKGSLKTSGGLM